MNYDIIMTADGEKSRIYLKGVELLTALQICKENDWIFVDENGVEYSLSIKDGGHNIFEGDSLLTIF